MGVPQKGICDREPTNNEVYQGVPYTFRGRWYLGWPCRPTFWCGAGFNQHGFDHEHWVFECALLCSQPGTGQWPYLCASLFHICFHDPYPHSIVFAVCFGDHNPNFSTLILKSLSTLPWARFESECPCCSKVKGINDEEQDQSSWPTRQCGSTGRKLALRKSPGADINHSC